jgi:serine/threonine protein kinase
MSEVFPRRFGKYVLLKSLARGGMGEIYVAARGDPGFQKFCVIKKVISERSDHGKSIRFLDEAKVVLRLAHANLVPTIDAGEHAGEFYIAMELVEGKDLREVWNRCVRTRSRIPLDVALHVAREVARALAYVHAYGDLKLVHRDVAPPNILLSYFGEVKLTDFGLARSVLKQEHTAPGIVFGRAAYLAPEQARGESADARSDIYSLGVVVWELLTGHQYLQLQNLDPATAMSLVRHPKPQPPSSKAAWITTELDAVIMRALAIPREERYQTAEEMRKALADVITRLSPRADAERAAEFLRGLVGEEPRDEQTERERLLAESASLPQGEDTSISDILAPPKAEGARGGEARADEATGVWKRPDGPAPAAPAAPTTPVPHAPPRADFTGRVVDGRYRILRVLGEGGMGTVYAGEHVEIGKGVAVKILHPQYSRQQDLVERFRREARAASRIGHPNIIDVTDFGTTEDGCAYFVMEHLDGIDLADVLSHERVLDPARACQIAVQICRALEAAHVAGVIHRDLKPENIFLVSRDGRADFVKVLDFGIARSLGTDSRRLTNPGIAMGTPEYMAPEQALGGPADRRSDIYSVAALLYEMVTGTPPHGDGDDASMMRKQEPPRPPRELRADLPDELERVILRSLELDPAKRHQRMSALEYDLTKTLSGRPRAVSDLLGLREPEARGDDSGGIRAQTTSTGEHTVAPATPGPVAAPGAGDKRGSGSRAAQPGARVAAAAPASRPMSHPIPGAGPPGPRALRYWGALTLLVGGAIVVVAAYRQLPWARLPGARVAPAAPVVDPRAARVKAVTAELGAWLAAPPSFARVPALEDRLARLRRDGAAAAADALATRAARALEAAASHELDAGAVDAGVAHYKIALGLDPGAPGTAPLIATLRARAAASLTANRPAEAVSWARTALALAEADPDGHALLAEALYAAHDDGAAAVEFGKALASRPADPAFKQGLARARHGAARARKRVAATDAARQVEGAGGVKGAGDDEGAARGPGSERGGGEIVAPADKGAHDKAAAPEAKPSTHDKASRGEKAAVRENSAASEAAPE